MVFIYDIRTRYSETGQDGIIHHSSYVVYLEVARLEFFKSIGVDINQLENSKRFCPVVDLSIKYLKTLRSLEDIRVEVAVKSCTKVRFYLDYKIYRGNECCTKGSTMHCFVDDAFKVTTLPAEIFSKFHV